MDPLLGTYLTFTAVLVATPGATTAVVVRNTLSGGRTGGLAAACGAAAANASHATVAGLGLAMVFARWPAALTALRLGGAGYLAWLGGVSLYRAVVHADGGLRLNGHSHDRSATDHRPGSFRQGLTVNLLNPAIATFYLVVVPTFVPGDAPGGYFVVLAAVHVVMALACHAFWAVGLDRLRRLFTPPRARRALEAATGLALIALGLRVLLR